MARFNQPNTNTNKTTNLAGGTAFSETPELRLVSHVLTSFISDQFYRTADEGLNDLRQAVADVDPLFAAKAAIYARNEFGMRSVSHVVAGELANRAAGQEWAKRFYDKIVRRPDDMTEIIAYYREHSGKKLSHALRKGFATALTRFDDYQLAKYRGGKNAVSLVDVVNLVHPKHSDALRKLVNDELRNTDTWEAKVSAAGKAKDGDSAKAEAWAELLKSRKIGYFALLRNLRNIIEQAPELVPTATELLTDERLIRKSLVLPFRYVTALEQVEQLSGREAKQVLVALNKALDLATANVPKFDGETLIAIDTSGSMYPMYHTRGKAPIKQASLFGAVLAKSNLADVMIWGDSAQYLSVNPGDSTMSIARQIEARQMGGTNMSLVFQEANRKYARIIILTDEQSWLHNYYDSPSTALANYRNRTGADPQVYSWDLAGYGTLQFPERQVVTLAGFSEKVLDIMKLVETDKNALINTIKAVDV